MKFDLTQSEGVWFDLPDGGRVKLKTLDVDDVMKIMKKTTKAIPFVHQEEGKLKVLTHEEVDRDLNSKMSYDATILDWEGITDSKNKKIPCNYENKIKLMRHKNPAFRNFIDECLAKLNEAETEREKEAEKN